jgi:AraC-like DNA-binding protein
MAVVRYREYRPCAALRDSVRAFFAFMAPEPYDSPAHMPMREVLFDAGDPFCSPLFADRHASIVFSFPRACRADGVWRPCAAAPRGDVIGPMTMVGPASLEERREMLGVYLRASGTAQLTRIPATNLTDRIIALEDLWGPPAVALAANLCDLNQEAARIGRLEAALLQAMAHSRTPRTNVDIAGLSTLVFRHRGQVSIQCMADQAGVSRQHLTRTFREAVGVTPKLFCRLARFHATLRYAYYGSLVPWADVAVEMGYSDQSHMIAEFRRFSSLTPEKLVRERWFHPFIQRVGDHLEPSRREP